MDSNKNQSASSPESPRVRVISPPVEVPVYNCVVLVSPRDDEGKIVARAANLAGVTAAGRTEREALQTLVAEMKGTLQRFRESGETIPWLSPPTPPSPGDQQRWIAIHL